MRGWGAADALTGTSGFANMDDGVVGMTLVSFTSDATTATSVVNISDKLQVTHFYHPSVSPNLYQADVSIKNIGGAPVELLYRRVMDWDIEPTYFNEFVTINTGTAANISFTSNNGFAYANPLSGPSDLGFTGSFTDAGPDDHGALFDFNFGMLAPGATKEFTIFYGAAANEMEANVALVDVGAEAFSFGQPNIPDGPTLGIPNTFVFAFSDTPIVQPVPKLINYQIKNLWEDYVRGKNLTELLNFVILGGNPHPNWVSLNASISDDDFVNQVIANIMFIKKDEIPLVKISPGFYSKSSYHTTDLGLIAKFFASYFGVELWFIETPDAYWEDVAISDIFNKKYLFTVNEKLPTFEDALKEVNEFRESRDKYFAWYSNVGSDRIDVLITDPAGRRIGTILVNNVPTVINEIPEAFIVPDLLIDESGMMVGYVVLSNSLNGLYKIDVYGKEAGTYSINTVWWVNGSLIKEEKIENRTISENEIQTYYTVLALPAQINIDPDTLNLKSKGKWIKAEIQISGYSANQIDVSSIRLNGIIPVDMKSGEIKKDGKGHGSSKLKVKFDRTQVQSIVSPGIVTLYISGKVNGTAFVGSDTIKVIGSAKKDDKPKSKGGKS